MPTSNTNQLGFYAKKEIEDKKRDKRIADGIELSNWFKDGKAVPIRDLDDSPYGSLYDKNQRLQKNHLYKNSRFIPNWRMDTDEGNWLVNDIVNRSRNYRDAEIFLWSLSEKDKKFCEANESTVMDEVYEYFSQYEKNHNGKE